MRLDEILFELSIGSVNSRLAQDDDDVAPMREGTLAELCADDLSDTSTQEVAGYGIADPFCNDDANAARTKLLTLWEGGGTKHKKTPR